MKRAGHHDCPHRHGSGGGACGGMAVVVKCIWMNLRYNGADEEEEVGVVSGRQGVSGTMRFLQFFICE